MKIQLLIILTPLLLFNIGCNSQQKNSEVQLNRAQQRFEVKKIEVTEQTRGTNRIITFIPGSKITSVNGSESVTVLSAADWGNIVKQAEMIDLPKISTLESPTEGRATDRALASAIIITTSKETFTSSSFDAGIPPKELEGLYKLLVDRNSPKSKLPKRDVR
ncbi:hypothetical protein [Chryseobacterium indologenes]|uniref:Uncharacterized protein n=1 Tax=Chryseobacterium indologenes TaxID=253 RepID=A0A0N0IUB0_CHRID|nr:hypothetical protein [Chryseobacterium indologenes]KPE49442.1 hypothetical protein AOB46_19960 [Chryseobacterium indologenes]